MPKELRHNNAAIKGFRALAKGEALPDQQVRALTYLVETVCGVSGLSYRDSDRETAFEEGRRFVGIEIMRLTKMDLNPTKEKDNATGRRASSRTGRDPDRNPATEYGGPDPASGGSINTSGRPRTG